MTLTGLAADTTYRVRVFSSDEAGNGPTSSGVISFTTPAPPDTTAPVILAGPLVTAITVSTAVVQWQTNETATTVVHYGTDDPPTTELSGSGYQTDHEMTLTGLAADTTYRVQVFSSDEAGNGPASSGVISFKTLAPPDTTAPVIVAGPLATSITDSTAVVVWQTNEPATSLVRYGTSDPPSMEYSISGYRTNHVVPLAGLTAGTTYRVQVFSSDESGNGPVSSGVISFKTLTPPDTTPPVIVAGPLVTAITDSTAVVGWQTNESATSLVRYGTSDPPTTELSVSGYQTNHVVTLTGLAAGTTYRVQAFSADEAGNGPASSGVVSFTTLAPPDTKAPVILAGPMVTSITDSTAVVEWLTNESATSVTRYGTGNPPTTECSGTGYQTDHTVPLTGLAPSTKYYLQVFSSDPSGNGPVSSGVVSFTTLALPDTKAPLILEGPIATGISDSSAMLQWATDEPSQSVALCGLSSPPGQRVSESAWVTGHNLVLSGLAPATTYFAQVFATDAAGNGPAESAVISFVTLEAADTTPPVILEGPMAIDISDTGATVYWTTDEPATGGVSYYDGGVYGVVRDDALTLRHSVRLTSLTPETLYSFTVASRDTSGNGPAQSDTQNFNTLATPDTSPPLIIEGPLIVNITHQSVVIRWETDESADTVIEYGLTDTLGLQESRAALVTHHNMPIVGLDPDTTYYFRVLSTDAVGNGPAASGVYSFKTDVKGPCQKPVFTVDPAVISATDTTATIYWRTDQPADSVVLYGTKKLTLSSSDSTMVTEHQITLTNLAAGQSYKYEARSSNECGEAAASGQLSRKEVETFTTNLEPDTTAPGFVSPPQVVNTTNTAATIQWTTDELADSRVSYGLPGKGMPITVGSTAFTLEHTVVLTNLSRSTLYEFKASSRDISRNGPTESGIASFITAAVADETHPVFNPEPAVSGITKDRATVGWGTDELATSLVVYGTAANDLRSLTCVTGVTKDHAVIVPALQAGTQYFYAAVSMDQWGNLATSDSGSFTTLKTLVTVPDVVGQAQTAAGAALTAANLTVGGITAQCSDTAAAGLVISQTPAAGGQTPSGSAVDLVVSSGPCAAEGEGETPETEASLRARLAVDFDVMDTDGNGTVSFAEALTTLTNLTQKVFNAVDTDGDGQISRDEAGLKPKCGCFGCKSAFTADTMKEFFSNVFPGV
jgi:chitodextrinase